MSKIMIDVLKDFVFSVITTSVYGLLRYVAGNTMKINELILFAVILFVAYGCLTIISPHLRKKTGLKGKK